MYIYKSDYIFSDQSCLIYAKRAIRQDLLLIISACMIYVNEYFALITEYSDHADIFHCMYLCNNSSKLFITV